MRNFLHVILGLGFLSLGFVHLWAVMVAVQQWGIMAGMVSFFFIGASALFWFVKIWHSYGLTDPFCIAFIVTVVCTPIIKIGTYFTAPKEVSGVSSAKAVATGLACLIACSFIVNAGYSYASKGNVRSATHPYPTWSQAEVDSVRENMQLAFDEAQTANKIIDGEISKLSTVARLTAKDANDLSAQALTAAREHTQAALSHAQMISDLALDKVHPELRENFRDYFQRSLTVQIGFYQTKDIATFHKEVQLYNQWIDWAQKHSDEFRVPLRGTDT